MFSRIHLVSIEGPPPFDLLERHFSFELFSAASSLSQFRKVHPCFATTQGNCTPGEEIFLAASKVSPLSVVLLPTT